MNSKKTYLFLSQVILIFLILQFNACDSNTEPDQTSVTLSFATELNLPKIAAEDLVIEEVKLLVKSIKIKNMGKEDSLHVKTGPIVVSLNLEGKTTEFANAEIPAGSYDRVRFEIHKIEDSETPPDAEFKEGTESAKRYSIIVKGKLNGEAFIYRSRKSCVQDIKLEEDLVVNENEAAKLTITVNPLSWFYEGDTLLNPNDSKNDDKIDNIIKTNFKRAFRDKNQDGLAD